MRLFFYLGFVGLLSAIQFVTSAPSWADTDSEDSPTNLGRLLHTQNDPDMLGVYISLTEGEKDELQTLLGTDLLTRQAGLELESLYRTWKESEQLVQWAKGPIKSENIKAESNDLAEFLRVVNLQSKPVPLSLLLVKAACAKPRTTTMDFLPAKGTVQFLKKEQALITRPKDAQQKCDRELQFYLQRTEEGGVKRLLMQSLGASRLKEFFQNIEWSRALRRIWLTAESWEMEARGVKNEALHLRAIEQYWGAFSPDRLARYTQLIGFLRSLEASGQKNLEACTVLAQFYSSAAAKNIVTPNPEELGVCKATTSVKARVSKMMELPDFDFGKAHLSDRAKNYALALLEVYRSAFSEILAEANTIDNGEVSLAKSTVLEQVKQVWLSPLAVDLYAELSAQGGSFDFDGEAARLVISRKTKIKTGLEFERLTLSKTLNNLKSIARLAEQSGVHLSAPVLKRLQEHRRLCESLLKLVK